MKPFLRWRQRAIVLMAIVRASRRRKKQTLFQAISMIDIREIYSETDTLASRNADFKYHSALNILHNFISII